MSDSEKKITVLEYILGAGSFIPVIGVLLGLVSIILGSIKFKVGGWKLILMGVFGIFFTVALFGAVFVHYKDKMNGGEVFTDLARKNLRQDVMALEFFKQVHGNYPQKLDELTPKTPGQYKHDVDVYDCSAGLGAVAKLQTYQYELMPDGLTYHLFGVGKDGKPDTSDDVFPEVSADETAHIGYRKK
jgi:hypothetical protein